MSKAKFMSQITLNAMMEQDERHPNRCGQRDQQELNDIIKEMLTHYPPRFLKSLGIVEA